MKNFLGLGFTVALFTMVAQSRAFGCDVQDKNGCFPRSEGQGKVKKGKILVALA